MCDGDVNVRKSGRGCALYFRGASKSSVPHSPVGNTVAQGLGHGIPECCTRLDVALADCHHEQSTLSLWCPGERHFDMKNGDDGKCSKNTAREARCFFYSVLVYAIFLVESNTFCPCCSLLASPIPNPYKLTTANKRQPIKSLPFSLVKPRCLLRSGTMSATRPFYSLCWAPTQVSLENERRRLGRSWGLAVIQSGRFSRIMLCNQVAYPIGFFWPPSI